MIRRIKIIKSIDSEKGWYRALQGEEIVWRGDYTDVDGENVFHIKSYCLSKEQMEKIGNPNLDSPNCQYYIHKENFEFVTEEFDSTLYELVQELKDEVEYTLPDGWVG